MAERPVIVVVDDEPDALAAMLDALSRRFGGDYRVIAHLSARAALEAITKIKEEKEDIALVIADQRMPEMTGREFLGQVRSVLPTAKRALIVDWGDHEVSPTILQACALGELDNYLYKPWAPAEVHLYPLINEFLAEWTRVHRPGMELIHIVGDEQATRSNAIRELLNRNGIPYGFHQIGSVTANRLIEERGAQIGAWPAVFLLDGSVLMNPTDAQIMDGVGESPPELFAKSLWSGRGQPGLQRRSTPAPRDCGLLWSSDTWSADKPAPVRLSETILGFRAGSAVRSSHKEPFSRLGCSAPNLCSRAR
jgi:thioredoxin reductase (NADPH)